MRRGTTLLILMLLLITPIILAEETTFPSPTDDQLGSIAGGLNDKTENVLEREVQIAPAIRSIMQLIFGLKKEVPVTIEGLILLFATWAMFFIIIKTLLTIAPFFEKGWQSIAGSVLITMLIALTGTMNIMIAFLLNIGETFNLLKAMGPFKILIAIALGALIIMAVNYFSNQLKRDVTITRAERAGRNIRTMGKMGEITSEN